MGNCAEPMFEECEKCEHEHTGRCIVEDGHLKRIVAKLDESEMLYLLWLLAKAKGAGEWDSDKFARSLAAAFDKAEKRGGKR